MTRVLVPLKILEGASVPPGLIDLLGTVDVTVLGYHVLPEQTTPDQARLQPVGRPVEPVRDSVDAGVGLAAIPGLGPFDGPLGGLRDRFENLHEPAERVAGAGAVATAIAVPATAVVTVIATTAIVQLGCDVRTGLLGHVGEVPGQ